MGSADHQFNLAELLTQNYNLQEGCAEAPQCPEKPEEELDKDFIDQVWGLTRPCPVALPGLHVVQPHAHGLHCGPASEPALFLRALAILKPVVSLSCSPPRWS